MRQNQPLGSIGAHKKSSLARRLFLPEIDRQGACKIPHGVDYRIDEAAIVEKLIDRQDDPYRRRHYCEVLHPGNCGAGTLLDCEADRRNTGVFGNFVGPRQRERAGPWSGPAPAGSSCPAPLLCLKILIGINGRDDVATGTVKWFNTKSH
jgi:hypothetical protein